MVLKHLDIHMQKQINFALNIKPHAKINWKWTTGLNAKIWYIGENLHNQGYAQGSYTWY